MDYLKENIADVRIISVNLERASFLEAKDFQTVLEFEIEQGGKNLVIDLSNCKYIDSVFLGSIILSLRKLVSKEGNIKLVKPSFPEINIDSLNSFRIFDIFEDKNQALKSFNKVSIPLPERFIFFNKNSQAKKFYSN